MRKFSPSEFNFTDSNSVSIIDELPLWSAPFGLKLLDMITLRSGMTVLDIGFGLGFPIIEVANRLGKTSKVYGIDPWKAAIERAKKKIRLLGMQNIELIEAAAENIPLPDSSVDLIVSNNGINNVQDIARVFAECDRVSKKGAQFVATVNLPESMIEFYRIFEEVLADLNLGDIIPAVRAHIHKKRLPVEELREIFMKNNFEIVQMQTSSFTYRFLDGTAMFDYPFIQNNFMDSWLAIVPENLVNEVFNEIEYRMNYISRKNGEWILTIPYTAISALKK